MSALAGTLYFLAKLIVVTEFFVKYQWLNSPNEHNSQNINKMSKQGFLYHIEMVGRITIFVAKLTLGRQRMETYTTLNIGYLHKNVPQIVNHRLIFGISWWLYGFCKLFID